jgi:hypothetical protein
MIDEIRALVDRKRRSGDVDLESLEGVAERLCAVLRMAMYGGRRSAQAAQIGVETPCIGIAVRYDLLRVATTARQREGRTAMQATFVLRSPSRRGSCAQLLPRPPPCVCFCLLTYMRYASESVK